MLIHYWCPFLTNIAKISSVKRSAIYLKKFDRNNNDAGSMHIAFNVKDIDTTYRNLKKLGFQCNQKPYPSSVPKGWAWFYARDPDGITVEFNGPIN